MKTAALPRGSQRGMWEASRGRYTQIVVDERNLALVRSVERDFGGIDSRPAAPSALYPAARLGPCAGDHGSLSPRVLDIRS
jgi:hypothetical protein